MHASIAHAHLIVVWLTAPSDARWPPWRHASGSARVPSASQPTVSRGRNMTSIGIVGTGISGLQLALTLQQAGVDTTLYAEHTPDEMRQSRLPNPVSRFGPTLARERALGVDHWADSTSNYKYAH